MLPYGSAERPLVPLPDWQKLGDRTAEECGRAGEIHAYVAASEVEDAGKLQEPP